MNHPIHAAVNILASIPLKYVLKWDWTTVVLFVIAGIAIDIDHLLVFIFKYKKLTPKAWNEIRKKLTRKMQAELYIFHSPEFNVILLILSYFYPVLLVILISNIVHLSIDALDYFRYHHNLLCLKKWSIIHSLKS